MPQKSSPAAYTLRTLPGDDSGSPVEQEGWNGVLIACIEWLIEADRGNGLARRRVDLEVRPSIQYDLDVPQPGRGGQDTNFISTRPSTTGSTPTATNADASSFLPRSLDRTKASTLEGWRGGVQQRRADSRHRQVEAPVRLEFAPRLIPRRTSQPLWVIRPLTPEPFARSDQRPTSAGQALEDAATCVLRLRPRTASGQAGRAHHQAWGSADSSRSRSRVTGCLGSLNRRRRSCWVPKWNDGFRQTRRGSTASRAHFARCAVCHAMLTQRHGTRRSRVPMWELFGPLGRAAEGWAVGERGGLARVGGVVRGREDAALVQSRNVVRA